MAYPGYGYGAPPMGMPPTSMGMMPPPVADPLWGFFSAGAGPDGQLDADGLQRCLTASGYSQSYQPFSKETCRVMIIMLDRDMSGRMGFNEFRELWQALSQWKNSFQSFDRDRSGTLDHSEIHQAIASIGYNLGPQVVGAITRRFSTNGRVQFDDFIACMIKVRGLTTQFQLRDAMKNGSATFRFDDFIAAGMSI